MATQYVHAVSNSNSTSSFLGVILATASILGVPNLERVSYRAR